MAAAARYVADLIAAACRLGWEVGCPENLDVPEELLARAREHFSRLPVRYYSEIFANLVVPPEKPVVADLADDLVDIYRDLYPGLLLFDAGKHAEAGDHWRFWFAHHWGEHATSAIRAIWSYLAGREGAEVR